jgi:hypothetical protein
MPKPKEALYYGLLEPDFYVMVKASSEQIAIATIKTRYPECANIVSQKKFNDKLYTNELMRIRVENYIEDDF